MSKKFSQCLLNLYHVILECTLFLCKRKYHMSTFKLKIADIAATTEKKKKQLPSHFIIKLII